MIANFNIFYIFITFHLHASTAEVEPAYRVNAMNKIFTNAGWLEMAEFESIAIAEPQTGIATMRVLPLPDLLKPDNYGRVVTYDNAVDKVRQSYQFLSCRYGHAIKMFYDYGVGAARQCGKIDDAAESLKCVGMLMGMIGEIDDLMSRLRGMFSRLYELAPATTFDTTVSKAVEDFQICKGNLNFDSHSLNKNHHKTIIASVEGTMAGALQRLRAFCDNFCSITIAGEESEDEETDNDISIATSIVQLEESRQPIEVMYKIEKYLSDFVKWYVNNYDKFSLGFEYDPIEKKTRIKNKP